MVMACRFRALRRWLEGRGAGGGTSTRRGAAATAPKVRGQASEEGPPRGARRGGPSSDAWPRTLGAVAAAPRRVDVPPPAPRPSSHRRSARKRRAMTMPNPFDGLPDILADRSAPTCDRLAPNFERETGL